MTTLIVGHRGTGKTVLARQFAPGEVIDLDAEIARATGRTSREWIEQSGETKFRDVEKEQLRRILNEASLKDRWIILGAGFPLNDFDWGDFEFTMIHWRRRTDSWGRIFTDRPRLNPGVNPLDEYFERFAPREEKYRDYADWTLEWPEGEHLNAVSRARDLLRAGPAAPLAPHSGIYTLRPQDRERVGIITEKFLNWGLRAFELRTDLLSTDDLEFWARTFPAERLLLAERTGQSHLQRFRGVNFGETDWALEWGRPPADYSIWSVHGSDPKPFASVPGSTAHLKWSPLVESFTELESGYRWQREDPERRSFLPRSTDGRWTWFRLWMKSRQKLNFIREVENLEAPDQPSFLEFINHVDGETFAAVVGDPILHSWTPGEQAGFFAARGMPVLRVAVAESEWDEAIGVLTRMGLRAAAVTSPLKSLAWTTAKNRSAEASRLRAVNTLAWASEDSCSGHNTDEEGLRECLNSENLLETSMPVRIYGGGGTLAMMRSILPRAACYSVRSQALRADSPPEPRDEGGLFIWAAGPRDPLPRFAVHPQIVLDLNYRADSAARELALLHGARYIDGGALFLAQAAAQRRYWSER